MCLIKQYMKRFVPVLCVMALLISCMVIPSFAAEIETSNDSGLLHSDLLTAYSYSILTDYDEVTASAPFARFNSNESNYIQFIWDLTNSKKFDKVIFAVQTFTAPSEVTFCGSTAVYLDKIDFIHSNDIYFYSVSLTKVIPKQIDISFDFASPYTGLIGIQSCVGLLDTAQSVSNVDIYRDDYFLVTEGYEFTEASPILNKSLPYTFSNFNSESGWWRSSFRFIIDSSDFVSPLVDKVSLMFTTCCTTVYPSVSLISKDSNASDVNTLKFNLSENTEWGTSGDYFQGYGEFEPYKTFQIDIDLSGYDLSNYDLLVTLGVDTITDTNGWDPCYLDLSLRSVLYVPFVENTPWYKSFFSPFMNAVSDGLGSIYNAIVDSITSVSNNFQSLFVKLEEYFGDDGSLSQAGEQMSEQSQQIESANSGLNSVEKPTLDTGSLFSGLLDFDTGGLTILSCMTSNVYVTQILIVVFTFALCGYVFFGKKG